MKLMFIVLIIGMLFSLFILLILRIPSSHKIIATVYIDNPNADPSYGKYFAIGGWYVLTNYSIDKNKCINFIDGASNKIHFCGNYKLTPIRYYEKQSTEGVITVWQMGNK